MDEMPKAKPHVPLHYSIEKQVPNVTKPSIKDLENIESDSSDEVDGDVNQPPLYKIEEDEGELIPLAPADFPTDEHLEKEINI